MYQELRREAVKYYTTACKEKVSLEANKVTHSSDLCFLHRLLKRPDKAFQRRLLQYDIFLARLLIKQNRTEVWVRKLCEAYISLRKRKQVVRWFAELRKYKSYVNERFYPRLFELMDKEGLWPERLLLSGQLPRHQSLDELS